jgi:hypothetical protein
MIFEPGKKIFISRHIINKHWYTCPIALPVRRNPQHRSLLAVVSATSAPPFQPLRHQRNVCHAVVNRFTRQTVPTVNRKKILISLALSPSAHKRHTNQNAALLYYIPQTRSPFWLLKPASEQAHTRLLPRLSWSWTVLLPSDTYRKPSVSIIYWLSLVYQVDSKDNVYSRGRRFESWIFWVIFIVVSAPLTQVNADVVLQIQAWLLPSTRFPIH